MKNDTIKKTDKIVMARYISGVSSSQKDKDGIFAEAEQVYDHGFGYNNVDKANNKAILTPETKTDGLDQSTINWALKKGILNVSKSLGDIDRDLEDIHHELATIPSNISTYETKINKNISDISNLFSHMEQAEDTIRDNYHRISDLEGDIDDVRSLVSICTIDTVDEYSVSHGVADSINPSERFDIYPKRFVAGQPAIFLLYPKTGYKFCQNNFNTADGPQIIYSNTWSGSQTPGTGQTDVNVSEDYKFFWLDDHTVLIVFNEAPSEDLFVQSIMSTDDLNENDDWLIHFTSGGGSQGGEGGGDSDPAQPTQTLSVNPTETTFDYDDLDPQTINVTSDSNWNVE